MCKDNNDPSRMRQDFLGAPSHWTRVLVGTGHPSSSAVTCRDGLVGIHDTPGVRVLLVDGVCEMFHVDRKQSSSACRQHKARDGFDCETRRSRLLRRRRRPNLEVEETSGQAAGTKAEPIFERSYRFFFPEKLGTRLCMCCRNEDWTPR